MSAASSRYRLVNAAGEDCGPARERQPRSRTYYSQISNRVCTGLGDLIEKSPVAAIVLTWICRQRGSTGGLRTSQSAIARYVGRPRESVVRALRLLEEMGFIATEPGAGREKHYFVDPELMWSGIPTSAAMGTAPYYKVRRAAGIEGVPSWRQGVDRWRLTRAERQTIAYVPDPGTGAAEDDLYEDEEV